jgi:hypothetical protein
MLKQSMGMKAYVFHPHFSEHIMKISIALVLTLTLCSIAGAQSGSVVPSSPSVALPPGKEVTPAEAAKAALAAHGGDKFKKLTALVLKGSVDLNVSNQIMPGAFSSALSGNKYYFEITTPLQSFKQVSDGQQTFSSLPGIMLPPFNSIGFAVVARVGDPGYVVSEYAAGKKKGRGFRIMAPDGFYTDFQVDEKTGQIKGFESAFELDSGRVITTSAVIEEVMTVEGVAVPKKYSQRYDMGGFTAYANFKVKEVLVNPQMAENAFAIPK